MKVLIEIEKCSQCRHYLFIESEHYHPYCRELDKQKVPYTIDADKISEYCPFLPENKKLTDVAFMANVR